MVIFSTAFIMVVLAEMGDKTQLLAMAFAAKYPWKKVMLGVLFATLLNHFVAIAAGIYLNTLVPQHIVEIVASVAFIIFGLWILKDDELGDEAEKSRFSIFWTVAIAFFLAEMGDKTQLATVALSAQIGTDLLIILIGTTVGMLVADGIGIALGIIWAMIFQGRGFMESLGFVMSGFNADSGVAAVDTLVNRGGFCSMLSLVGMIIVIGMLSGLFNKSGVLNVLVGGLTKRLRSPKSIILGAGVSSILMAMAGGQYPSIAIPAVAFKDICDEMDINRAVLARMLADTGVVVSSIIFWNAWTMGYGVVLGGFSTLDTIPYNFLAFVCPIVAVIFNFLGIGFFHKDEEVKYHLLWKKTK